MNYGFFEKQRFILNTDTTLMSASIRHVTVADTQRIRAQFMYAINDKLSIMEYCALKYLQPCFINHISAIDLLLLLLLSFGFS